MNINRHNNAICGRPEAAGDANSRPDLSKFHVSDFIRANFKVVSSLPLDEAIASTRQKNGFLSQIKISYLTAIIYIKSTFLFNVNEAKSF